MTPVSPANPDGARPPGPQGSEQREGRSVIRTALRVEGIVQGVGFRPFVYSLATSLGLAGLVGNDVDGVFAEVEGDPAAVREFLDALERDAPPLARIERVTATGVAPAGAATFEIVASEPMRAAQSPDRRGHRDLRGLPARARRPGRQEVPVPVHQLHQLRPQVHHRQGRPLRPPADDHGRVPDVRAVRRRVPRPRQPPLPRPASLLPRLRPPADAARRDGQARRGGQAAR